MKNKSFTGKLFAFIALVTILLGMAAMAHSEDAAAIFEQSVPFGVAHADDGGAVPVFSKPGGSESAGALHDFQICAVVAAERLSGVVWYRINYFDDAGKEVSGYVPENSFYHLTVAGFVAVMADPQAAAYIQNFSGLDSSSAYVLQEGTATRSGMADEAEQSEENNALSEQQLTYVLNAGTMKFHFPDCSSVPDIKPSNRRDFTGTREEAVQLGYSPCGRCHP